ncbi:MAG: glycosidase [Thermoprotei archaeon]
MRRSRVNDIFERILYIGPDNFLIVNYLKKRPIALFNPGVSLDLDRSILEVFPRIVFDYYWYVSSIGYFTISVNDLNDGELTNSLIKTRLVIWPEYQWEIAKGIEDPRVMKVNDRYHVLHTSVAFSKNGFLPLQGYTILDHNLNVLRKTYLKIWDEKEEYIPQSWKDSAFLNLSSKNVWFLTRPTIEGLEVGWKGMVDVNEGLVYADSMEPVLAFEDFEIKVGWSTNTVKVSQNEYLVGWHGEGKDLIYRNGLAITDSEGNLLGTTDYVLSPKGIIEFYGDRPGVIFGCGLIIYKEYVYWIGGISDYAIGIFRTQLDKIFENIRWVKKN